MSSSDDASLLQASSVSRNFQVPPVSDSHTSSASEAGSLFYQSVSEAALLQALQNTLTGEGNATATPLSTAMTETVSIPNVTMSVSGNDKQISAGQGTPSSNALMGLLGNLSAAQLLMVYITYSSYVLYTYYNYNVYIVLHENGSDSN